MYMCIHACICVREREKGEKEKEHKDNEDRRIMSAYIKRLVKNIHILAE